MEDQILLLQNGWAELVSLGAIWRSRFSSGEIKLSFGKSLDLQKAREMEHEEVGVMFFANLAFIPNFTILHSILQLQLLSLFYCFLMTLD